VQATLGAPPPGSVTTSPPPKEGADPRAPTILAALCASTEEERAADPEKADKLARDLYDILTRWAQHHEPIYREADENADFVAGRMYGYTSVALNARVAVPEAPKGTLRLTYNYLRRGVTRGVAILMKDPPIIKCLAGDSEVLDQAASEAADDVVDWRQRCAVLACEPERVAETAFIGGTCWVHEEYDTTAGPLVETGEIRYFGDDGLPLPVPEKVQEPQGEYAREILSWRQGVPDPAATHIFGGSAFFVRKRMSRFDLHRMKPELDIGEFPPDGEEKLRRVEGLGRGMTSTGATSPWDGGTVVDLEKDAVEVAICYVPKCADYPKGRRILLTKNRLLEEMDNPRYPTDEEIEKGETEPVQSEEPCWPVFPFIHMFRTGGKPFGYSPVHDAIPCNKAINGLGSKALQHAALIANSKVKVPNDLATEWNDANAQVFKVPRRGFDHNTLGYISPPPMPQEYLQLWHENKDTLYEFLGLNQPAVGQQETTGQSGYAIKLRQQTADNDLERVRTRHNNMWACVFRYDLFLFRRHATTKRKIEVLGENRRVALKALDGTAILPATNVLCVNDAAIPRNPAERMIWLQQFMATGVMKLPPEQRQEMFQLMRLQDFKAFEERKAGDRMRAERQIRRIMGNEEPGQISDMDDHLVQMSVLREFGLSEEFENKVKQELMAGQPELQPGQPPAPPMPGAAPPTSLTFTRLTTLYDAHKQAMIAQTQAPTDVPKEMMNFKDLPPAGQQQMAAQAGIQIGAPKAAPGAPAKGAAPPAQPAAPPPDEGGGLQAAA
jgi:hypothetical protein